MASDSSYPKRDSTFDKKRAPTSISMLDLQLRDSYMKVVKLGFQNQADRIVSKSLSSSFIIGYFHYKFKDNLHKVFA